MVNSMKRFYIMVGGKHYVLCHYVMVDGKHYVLCLYVMEDDKRNLYSAIIIMALDKHYAVPLYHGRC